MSSTSFSPPDSDKIRRYLSLNYWYFTPKLLNAESLDPTRPSLFVGNHAIFGGIDAPLFLSELYRKTGIFPRTLGDHFHFQLPGWRELLAHYGVVEGNRDNCRELMQAGEPIMVFPGGAREVAKRRDELHRLHWKKRTGFVRMALEHGYDIVPFASAGCDFSYDILFDGNDFRESRWGNWLLQRPSINRLMRNGDIFMPLVRGLGPTLLPRPEPFLFSLGQAITTEEWKGQQDDDGLVWDIRHRVSDSINTMLTTLTEQQQRQPISGWRKRLLSRN